MKWLRTPKAPATEGKPNSPTAPEFPETPDGVLQICHPDWRGVRATAYAFQDPVLEMADLGALVPHVKDLADAGVTAVVIMGWPPNAAAFATAASAAGISVKAVFLSSPAQHGIDGGEADAVHQMLELRKSGILSGVATVKAGVAEALQSIGYDVQHVGSRVPVINEIKPANVRQGTNVGIMLQPMWRKNVTTQILAALELGWQPFVMADPLVPYLASDNFTVCGELPYAEFLAIQAAMDISFNVTLSECHPMIPMESYRSGIPCLISNTSDLFLEDDRLRDLTVVEGADSPGAIARAAARLLDNGVEAVSLANVALDRLDRRSLGQWLAFTRG